MSSSKIVRVPSNHFPREFLEQIKAFQNLLDKDKLREIQNADPSCKAEAERLYGEAAIKLQSDAEQLGILAGQILMIQDQCVVIFFYPEDCIHPWQCVEFIAQSWIVEGDLS
jgi:hypothetical protein